MRAMAVFPERRELRIIEVPNPVLTDEHDVIVKVREVGVCGTDREICDFHYGMPPAGSERLVLGHEAFGEVVEVGPAVRTLKPGDLVAMTVRRPCTVDACVACRAGRQDFCITGTFRERGIKEADGFMTEFVVEQERYLVKVPPTPRGRRGPHRAADHRGQSRGRSGDDPAAIPLGAHWDCGRWSSAPARSAYWVR